MELHDEQLSDELPEDVVRALQLGRRAEAIALLRDATRIGPLAARRTIDEFIARHPDIDAPPPPRASLTDTTPQRLLLIAIILILGLLLVFL